MKLTEIRIRQFKVFRSGLDITDLESGITIFHGPNESGKSTLAQAIRTAFFERHGSTTLSELQPWGDSSAAPEVSLKFEFDGRKHHLIKRFVRQRRCDLNVDGELLSKDEAEHYLARLMGFSMPGRGASRPEHWGVPGLLWIEQGAGHELQAPVAYAKDHLQGTLNDAMGHVASSDGDRVLQEVADQLDQLLTRGGAPRLDYRKAIEEKQRLGDELASLDDKIQAYQHDVDELASLHVQHEREASEQPWRQMRQQEQQAREQLAHVNVMRTEQQREHNALDVCKQTQVLLQQQLETFSQQARNVRTRELELARERERHQGLTDQTAVLQQALDAASKAYGQARDALTLSRQAQQRHDKEKQLVQGRADLRRLDEHQEQAKTLQDQLEADQARAIDLRVDPELLNQLRTLHDAMQSLEIRQRAIATRLEFDLDAGQHVSLDGAAISGQSVHLLLTNTLLSIPGVGDVRITPGGDDVSSLARERERLNESWASCLQALRVASLEQAQQRAAEHTDVMARIRQHQAVLTLHAPDGIAALKRQHADVTARLDVLQREYDDLPLPTGSDVDDLAMAQVAEQTAERNLKESEAQLQTHRVATATAQAELDAAQREYQRAYDTLHDAERAASEQQTLQRLHQERTSETLLSQRIAQLQVQIDAVHPDILEQDIVRYSQSAARSQDAFAERERTIRELKGRLQALGAQALEERRHALAGQHAVISRRVDEFAANAAALTLLHTMLQEKRQALTRQLHEPLKQRLMHYLKVLFNAADDVEIMLGDDLMPRTLTRHNTRADLQALSFGAREQMGLISRLAYADLLKEAGQPTLLMLDDALLHSDDSRLAHMKRILFDAAQRHQIFLFTCHPEKWRDMGVTPRAIRDLLI